MPGGDRTGPPGQGLGQAGRGMGKSGSKGRLNGNRYGVGPSGDCICPQCGARLSHQRGIPCYSVKCPKCQAKMARL